MEVHKHPHHVTHKKKWTEYLLEFFMLFLAVFLGFVAENIRENSVERHREKEYMVSLVHDLQSDTTDIQYNLDIASIVSKKTDTLIETINFKNIDSSIAIIYRLARETARLINVTFEDRTASQLKTSGMLLIKNEKVANAIRAYWGKIKIMDIISSRLSDVDNKANDLNVQLFNNKYYPKRNQQNPFEVPTINANAELLTKDKIILAMYSNRKNTRLAILYNYINKMNETKSTAIELIQLIKNEYHLEKD